MQQSVRELPLLDSDWKLLLGTVKVLKVEVMERQAGIVSVTLTKIIWLERREQRRKEGRTYDL